MTKALYREYRSRSFDQVIGQSHITETLKRSFKNGSVSHAYLLSGPRGVGKTSVARIMAHEVNNLEYSNDDLPIDIIEIDAASNRRIDEIRSLRERVHIAPVMSKYKVYIIDEVHMLTREAFNALLKTLEEPPSHVIFILATTEFDKLPDTIVSRCITLNFKPIADRDLVNQLRLIADKEKITITDDSIKMLARHSNGSFRDAITLLDQVKYLSDNVKVEDVELVLGLAPINTLNKIVTQLESRDQAGMIETVHEALMNGVTEQNLATQIGEKIRTMLIGGTLKIPPEMALSILHSLLKVQSSASPRLELELTLLDYACHSNNPQHILDQKSLRNKTLKQSQSNEQTRSIDRPNFDKQPLYRSEPADEKSIKSPQKDNDLWSQVLKVLKSKNNTLYGVARMAKAELSETVLLLQFEFSFHFKQVSQERNRSVITKILEDRGYKNIKIVIKLSENRNSKESKNISDSKNHDDLTSINNIFGPTEMLE